MKGGRGVEQGVAGRQEGRAAQLSRASQLVDVVLELLELLEVGRL